MLNLKFYRIGMISLLFLPMLFIPYVKKEFQKRDLRWLKLNMPSPDYEKSLISFNYYNLDKIRDETEFIEVNTDNLSELEIESHFKNLIKQHNENFYKNKPESYKFGIKIKLGSNSTYNTFVKILNDCAKYKISHYAFDTRYDEFYIIVGKYTLPNYFASDVIYNYNIGIKERSFLEYLESYFYSIITLFNQTKYIFILYLALVLITYFRLKTLKNYE